MSSPLLSALTASPGPHPLPAELRAYAAGELTGPAAQRIEAHALACTRCADVLEGLQQTDPATTNRLLTDLQQRLHQRVRELDQRPKLAPAPGFRTWPRLAAAAVLVAGLGAGIWGWQHQTPAAEKATVVAMQRPPRPPASAAALSVPDAASAVGEAPATSVLASRPVLIAAAPPAPNRLLTRPASRLARARTSQAAQIRTANQAAAPDKEVRIATVETAASTASAAALPSRVTTDSIAATDGSRREVTVVSSAPNAVKSRSAALAKVAASEVHPAPEAAPVAAAPGSAVADGTSYLRSTVEGSAPRTRAALPPPPALEPMPTGGYQALRTYLKEQAAEFEPEAPLGPLKGLVRVRFTISAAGKPELEPTEVKFLRSLRSDYNAEVLRMLKEGPTWIPGVAAGRRAPLPVQVEVLF